MQSGATPIQPDPLPFLRISFRKPGFAKELQSVARHFVNDGFVGEAASPFLSWEQLFPIQN